MVATNSVEMVGPQSANLRSALDEDGFVVCRGVFSREEIALLAEEADALLRRTDLIDKLNLRCRFQSNCEAGDCVFETFDPVIDIAPSAERIAGDSRILELLGSIYGEQACLFKDKLIYKPAGAMGCGLHQDYIAWPGFPKSFTSVVVPIDAATDENGCIEISPEFTKEAVCRRRTATTTNCPQASWLTLAASRSFSTRETSLSSAHSFPIAPGRTVQTVRDDSFI